MCIGEEASRVCLDLSDPESSSVVGAVRHDACRERADQTSDGTSELVVADRVGEGDPYRTGATTGTLVDVCSGDGGGLEDTGDVDESDVLGLVRDRSNGERRVGVGRGRTKQMVFSAELRP